jgi:hypothetical protein
VVPSMWRELPTSSRDSTWTSLWGNVLSNYYIWFATCYLKFFLYSWVICDFLYSSHSCVILSSSLHWPLVMRWRMFSHILLHEWCKNWNNFSPKSLVELACKIIWDRWSLFVNILEILFIHLYIYYWVHFTRNTLIFIIFVTNWIFLDVTFLFIYFLTNSFTYLFILLFIYVPVIWIYLDTFCLYY